MLVRAYDVLEPMFIESVLPESGHSLLASADYWEPLLDTLPDAAKNMVGANLSKKWSGKEGAMTSPAEKWEQIKQHLETCFGKKGGVEVKKTKNVSSLEKQKIENWPFEVVFKYTYPRLDINVSKMQNHLLKSPFCVHPKTGRVCVPIQVETVDDFDPFQVPTLAQLMKELDEYQEKEDSGRKVQDWHKTSLKEYFEPFQKEFLEPMLKDLRRKGREEAEEQAAVIGDF
jgi:DNA primase small subunit